MNRPAEGHGEHVPELVEPEIGGRQQRNPAAANEGEPQQEADRDETGDVAAGGTPAPVHVDVIGSGGAALEPVRTRTQSVPLL